MSNPILAGLKPTHPGEILREIVLPETKVNKSQLAKMLGISRQTLYAILRGEEPVSPRIAIRLGHVFGNGAAMWGQLQLNYDLALAAAQDDLTDVPTLASA